MNRLSDEEKIIKKAMEEFDIPFDAAAWEKAEILLDKQVKTKWLYRSLIAVSILAALSVSLYLFSPEKSPVSGTGLMEQTTHEDLLITHDNKEHIAQSPIKDSDKILKENNPSDNINTREEIASHSGETQNYLGSNTDRNTKEYKKPLSSFKKGKPGTQGNGSFIVSNAMTKPENNPDIKTNQTVTDNINPFQHIQKEKPHSGEENLKEDKNQFIAKNEVTNETGNPWENHANIMESKTNNPEESNTQPKEEPIVKTPEKMAKADSIHHQNKTVPPDPVQKYDKRFIVGVSAGITAYKRIDKEKTSSVNYTPALGVFIQKNIKEKLGVKMAFHYNQVLLNNISKTYEGSVYSFGKSTEAITVSPGKLHLLHSNISFIYQYRPQLNFQLGATYIYAFNAKNNFEENKQGFNGNTHSAYTRNSSFFNGYQAIPAIQLGTEYRNKKGIRYGAYLQQGVKSLVNEKQFGTVQSKTLFNLNLYLAYDLSRF